ncbi:hypothetical protein FGG08_006985 [Glutinoglossum americanum]|uniref:Xylanolytic transcriptional activator regulatory domain-containing protein n=1 Tax=Glutinoglossum americanum TaxID=1670608 RepID=A0A9P8KZU2_9PEZI|nr:hypothetical protein FGG08_006985 [Glutinoglossum americanum]
MLPGTKDRTQGQHYGFKDNSRQASLAAPIRGALPVFPAHSPTLSFNGSILPSRYLSKLSCDGPTLPDYIKPLPVRIAPDDVEYLAKKGALTVPEVGLRNELLRSYLEYVHPYMPLLELHNFLNIVERGNGSTGKLSLLLFQAVMFAGTAFVDMKHLGDAGYTSRKAARKAFFQKTRLLYDFDYEHDRIALVQALLLMTYWYETPDDQKDTWHWMGVAISLSHTIGLHRNPGKSKMDHKRQRLWKRIWWSCFMRDRLVALGMRRPTRIKSEDYDVPILTLDDFEISSLNPNITCISADCLLARDPARQRELAIMCIEKAKLCVCISHVLSAQYSVLNNNQGAVTAEGNTTTTMMLLPRKLGAETCEVRSCDDQLSKWIEELPEEAAYQTPVPGAVDDVLTVHRALLHMVYYTTLSALHRPQVLPSAPAAWPARNNGAELHEISRNKVRRAAAEITRIGKELRELDLVKYLPTTGVTVLLPAIIIHLLDIKSLDEKVRNESLLGFSLCMQVIHRLRENYAAADYATHFLEAAIRKANIQVVTSSEANGHGSGSNRRYHHLQQAPKRPADIGGLLDMGRRIDISGANLDFTNALTPPPDQGHSGVHVAPSNASTDELIAAKLEAFVASTPPDSEPQDGNASNNSNDATTVSVSATNIHELGLPAPNSPLFGRHHHHSHHHHHHHHHHQQQQPSFDQHETLDSFLHIPSSYPDPFFGHYDDGAPISMHGESSGFTLDMDWMNDNAADGSSMSFLDPAQADFDMDDVIAQGLTG